MTSSEEPRATGFQRVLGKLQQGARNAFELLTEGRLGAPYRAPFEIVEETSTFRLRRYTHPHISISRPPFLLVPPLMVTSEVYDISPELSAVTWLRSQGVDVWLVDFGAPEQEDGMERTLDDHVLAVDAAISHVAQHTQHPVHLAGYSQGGMFVYQAAAYRRSKDLASLITFGSPVDMRRNIPVKVHEGLADKVLHVARVAIRGPLEQIEGLPGSFTSGGFKLLSPRKELQQIVSFFGLLHDRDALEKREPRRRFLGGEGFVAWPGPAFRQFVDDMVVHNRMVSGGFVIGGKTVTLADIHVPILYFVGTRDDFARPPSVRAIRKASPEAPAFEEPIPAGHFGLVVGSKAMQRVWPSVLEWLTWSEGPRDDARFVTTEARREERRLRREQRANAPSPDPSAPQDGGVAVLYDLATDLMDSLWRRLGDVSLEAAEVMDTLRWQLPRLARIKSLRSHTPISFGLALQEQAEAIPDETFFLWKGRAFSYADANRRVNQVLDALVCCGVSPGDHVGLLMDNHPNVLTLVGALSRLGAVAVMLNAGAKGRSLQQATQAASLTHLVADPPHIHEARSALPAPRDVFIMGEHAELEPPHGVVDLDSFINPEVSQPPPELDANPGLASDTAMLMFTSGTTGLPKAAVITNRRWSVAALAAAAAAKLTPADTVYCCLPLHHATGMIVAVGGALIGGCRLALAPRFSADTFWPDVRRYGATVTFYVGELCRYLVAAPEQPGEREHPLRLLVGNGMRADVWQQLLTRFGPLRVLEFYGSTEGNVALANLTGDKIGSVGQALSGTALLVRYDPQTGTLLRDDEGFLIPCETGEVGVLLGRIEKVHPLSRFEGYVDPDATAAKVIGDAFVPGDAWFHTGDLLRQDEDGDFWFVDRLGDTFRWKGENVSTEQVAQVLTELPGIDLAVVYGIAIEGYEGRAGMAALQLHPGADLDPKALYAHLSAHLSPAACPRFIRVVSSLETTPSFKFVKQPLVREGITQDTWIWSPDQATFQPLNGQEPRGELL